MTKPRKSESEESILPECPKSIPRIRPPGRVFKTQEECKRAVDKYFDFCDEHGIPYTVTGLCISMGVDRSTWQRWLKQREDLKSVLEAARSQIEHQIEIRLLTQKNVAGPIFNLVNNFKWHYVKVIQDETLTNDLVNRLMEAKEKKRKLLESFNQTPEDHGPIQRVATRPLRRAVIN